MPTLYKYKALTENGTPHHGEITAENQDQVLDYLTEQNLIPINVKAQKARSAFSFLGFFKGIDYENLIVFTNNLFTLYRAGIPLLRIMSIIKIGPPHSRFNHAIQQMTFSLQSGKSLSESMAEFDDLFSQSYRTCIMAGEESGKLDDILEELTDMLEKEMELTRQIKSGIRYPIMVISAIVSAFVVVMTFVIPKFISFYGAFGAQLPLPTKILISTSDFFTHYWWLMLTLLAISIYGFTKLIRNEKGKFWFDKILLKIPVFGDLIIKGNVARFCLMFRILIKSGIPIVKSLQILTNSIKNIAISAEITKVEELFRQGKDSELKDGGINYFPELALEMISIGLESGSLDKMLQTVGLHYSKEVQYTSKHLTSILEPILTLVLSILVLFLALAMLLPMWNLIKVFNAG